MKRALEEESDTGKDNVTASKKAKYPVCIFPTKPRHRFDGKFPYFRQPKEIGKLSIDLQRAFHNDKSQLKFYIQPDNLNHTDFICWRGLLTKLLCTPYENREGWMIAVTLFNGTYYLCEFETEQKKQQKEQRTERQDEMTYWGWKFEQYITSDTVNGKPKTDIPVNNCEGFCTVVRSRLDQHSIGEVDAVDPSINGETQYVEFKTTREIDNPRQNTNFKRFKLIKWWAQSFLVGIPQIICGFRDDDGIVHRLKKFNVQEIPNTVTCCAFIRMGSSCKY
ncbi:hypothetical protein KUTeg_003554 [Tegillarca granosa]|uniref:Decapping nuclease n=1 Tax=Tegillarca granosa TaxID=220873 RepID=A0ABQ9FRZ6_TEGGR|nr:hypothetical protein KUTeg_003554 [Tegillarca granosa]